jgi:hypothetical protein
MMFSNDINMVTEANQNVNPNLNMMRPISSKNPSKRIVTPFDAIDENNNYFHKPRNFQKMKKSENKMLIEVENDHISSPSMNPYTPASNDMLGRRNRNYHDMSSFNRTNFRENFHKTPFQKHNLNRTIFNNKTQRNMKSYENHNVSYLNRNAPNQPRPTLSKYLTPSKLVSIKQNNYSKISNNKGIKKLITPFKGNVKKIKTNKTFLKKNSVKAQKTTKTPFKKITRKSTSALIRSNKKKNSVTSYKTVNKRNSPSKQLKKGSSKYSKNNKANQVKRIPRKLINVDSETSKLIPNINQENKIRKKKKFISREVLDLSGNHFSESELEFALSSKLSEAKMRILVLRNCQIDDSKLVIILGEILRNKSRIEVLDLRENHLSSDALATFQEFLKMNPGLNEIRLQNNFYISSEIQVKIKFIEISFNCLIFS